MSAPTVPANRKDFTLADAARQFSKHPSPLMIGAMLVAALAMRIALGDWQITDALVSASIVTAFPFLEWAIHVFILHWRPKHIGKLVIDPLLAHKHRQHHADPRVPALVFIPAETLPWILAGAVAIALLAFPRVGLGLTFLTLAMALGLCYEWTHHLIHTDYKPKTSIYRAIWRNHRLHHFKNEHYWFTITTSGTADRVLRTYPDPATVPTSPTAKDLHASRSGGAARNQQRPARSRQNPVTDRGGGPKDAGLRNRLPHIGVRLSSVLQSGVGRSRQ
ncbi:fatty acid hydroxylase [Mycobacterium xenopi]|uniref:Fatty acid hydroxylase n=2 Tax=Mycobacterium xenopi TaxID=1789 RepID=A0AAD1H3G4_MYCXE|nr:fatty acid hydroxylase [Mycobacterium xenopi]SPX90221.1 fatty acid hydroxylase [Mycobacterium xenopi]